MKHAKNRNGIARAERNTTPVVRAGDAHRPGRLGPYLLLAAALHLLLFVAVRSSWLPRGAPPARSLSLKMEVGKPDGPRHEAAAPRSKAASQDPVISDEVIARAIEEAETGAADSSDSFHLHSQRHTLRSNLWQAAKPAPGEVLESFSGPHGPRAILRRRSGETLCFMTTPVRDGTGEASLLWIRVRC